MANDDPPRRFSDEMLIRLDQKLSDHLNWSIASHTSILERLVSLESFKSKTEKPLQAAGWIFITFIGSIVISIAGFIWHLATHIKITR